MKYLSFVGLNVLLLLTMVAFTTSGGILNKAAAAAGNYEYMDDDWELNELYENDNEFMEENDEKDENKFHALTTHDAEEVLNEYASQYQQQQQQSSATNNKGDRYENDASKPLSSLTSGMKKAVNFIKGIKDPAASLLKSKQLQWVKDIGKFIATDILYLQDFCSLLYQAFVKSAAAVWKGTVSAFNNAMDVGRKAGALVSELSDAFKGGPNSLNKLLNQMKDINWKKARQKALKAIAVQRGIATKIYDSIVPESVQKVVKEVARDTGRAARRQAERAKRRARRIFGGRRRRRRDDDKDYADLQDETMYHAFYSHRQRRRLILGERIDHLDGVTINWFDLENDENWKQFMAKQQQRRRLSACNIPDPNLTFDAMQSAFSGAGKAIADGAKSLGNVFSDDDDNYNNDVDNNAERRNQASLLRTQQQQQQQYGQPRRRRRRLLRSRRRRGRQSKRRAGRYENDYMMYPALPPLFGNKHVPNKQSVSSGGKCRLNAQGVTSVALKLVLCLDLQIGILSGSLCVGLIFQFGFDPLLGVGMWEWSAGLVSNPGLSGGFSLGVGLSFRGTGAFMGSGITYSIGSPVLDNALGASFGCVTPCSVSVGLAVFSSTDYSSNPIYGCGASFGVGVSKGLEKPYPVAFGASLGVAYKFKCTQVRTCTCRAYTCFLNYPVGLDNKDKCNRN